MIQVKEEIKQFINNQKWTFAKTYAKTAPHEYVVRDHLSDGDKEVFDLFAQLIETDGYTKKFYDMEYTYFDIDDKRYWVMGNILNRDDVGNNYKK